MRRATLAVLVLSLGAASCKRRQAPPVEEVWDESASEDATEALGGLAPAWPRPTRATLDNGLVVHWLHEPDAPAVHVRIMAPTVGRRASAPVVAVVAELFRAEVERRGRGIGLAVRVEHGPGRVELVTRGAEPDTERILELVADVLAREPSSSRIDRARTRVARTRRRPTPDEAATSALVADLLGESGSPIDPKAARSLPRGTIAEGWAELGDPRSAVMVVHGGRRASALREPLRELSERWRGRDRRDLEPGALARLRPEVPGGTNGPPRHLLTEPAAPLRAVASARSDDPVLLIGRVIPTESAAARSMARLAQRVLQEEVDARLVVAGPRAVLIVRVPLSGSKPEQAAAKAVARLSELANARHQAQRVFQAAQLWLGARVVEASVHGEDWTGLWGESIDLATTDAEIHRALARDAKAMLDVDPEGLLAWQKRWLDPRAGERGWSWVVAGAGRHTLQRLQRLTAVVASES